MNSDLMPPNELAQIRVLLLDNPGDPPNSALDQRIFDLSDHPLPFSFGVQRTTESETELTLVFEAIGPAGPPGLFESRATTEFVEGKTVRITVFLSRACIPLQQTCMAPMTCRNGSCAADRYQTEEVEAGDELAGIMWPMPMPPPMDAGVGPMDAGPPPPMDGGPPPPDGGPPPPMDAGPPPDAAPPPPDAGFADSGLPVDSGVVTDSGIEDSDVVSDAGMVADAGVDAGVDAGTGSDAGDAGPGPVPCSGTCQLSDCPPGSQGCECRQDMMMNMICVPTCSAGNTFCPPPLMCDTVMNICVP